MTVARQAVGGKRPAVPEIAGDLKPALKRSAENCAAVVSASNANARSTRVGANMWIVLLISCVAVESESDAAPTTPLYTQKAGIMRVEFDDAVCFCPVGYGGTAISCPERYAVSCIAKPAAP